MDTIREARKKELLDMFSMAPIEKYFGTRLSFDDAGHARLDLPYNPNLDQLCGIHGGVMATLLDAAGFFASALVSKSGLLTTSELSIHFLNPAVACDLHAEGRVIKSGKRISIAETRVSAPNGSVIAIATGTYVAL